MSNYLPQETFIVCSHQMDPAPGVLLADPKMWNLTVIYKSEKKPLLTEVDMVLKDDFECKSNWGKVAAWSFLVAGLALGLAVAFSICTFGVGAVILGAIAIAATVAIASNSTKCNPNLVEWVNPHSNVNFEGHKALTQKSFLTCSAGPGVLTPFLDESEANAAAKNVAFRNWGEVSLTAAISGLFGFGIGLSGGTALAGGGGIGAAFFAGGKEALVGVVGAYLIFQPVAYLEAQGMQGMYSSDSGDTAYDQMLASRKELEGSFTIDTPDDPYIGTSQTSAAENILYHSYDRYRQNQNEKYIKEIMNLKGTRAEREARIAEIVTEMKKTRSGAQAVEAMKRQKSGKILPRVKTSNKGNKVISHHKAETTKGMKAEAAKGFGGGINVAGLVLPLLVSPLNEWTFSVLADSFENQSGGGMTIHSVQN